MAERSFTLDDSTEASHPGGVKISKWRWFMRYPRWPMVLTLVFVGAVVAAVTVHWGSWLLVPPPVVGGFYYWRRIREHFLMGCANPGRVVSTSPLLIAVRTDLSHGRGYYPVVKVIKEKPSGRWSSPPVEGERVVTVALYSAHSEGTAPHWGDFDPLPVEPVAVKLEDATRLLESLPDEEWSGLDRAIADLPAPEVGLHRVEVDSSDWCRIPEET